MGVSGEAPTRAQMSMERFGRNDADDRFMVAAAKLVFDLILPTEGRDRMCFRSQIVRRLGCGVCSSAPSAGSMTSC